MNSAPRHSITLAFLVAVALLAGVNWYVLTRTIDVSPIRSTVPSVDTSPDAVRLMDVDVLPSSVSEIVERPLFEDGRKPLQSAEPVAIDIDEANSRAAEPGVLTLVGTMQWGNAHRALIRVASDPLARWISVGGTIEGWTLKGIEKNSIVVERNSRTVEIPIVLKPAAQRAGSVD